MERRSADFEEKMKMMSGCWTVVKQNVMKSVWNMEDKFLFNEDLKKLKKVLPRRVRSGEGVEFVQSKGRSRMR